MSNTAFDSLLQELAQKDFLTYQHSIAVAEHMRNLAQALGMDEDGMQEAEIIGAIHDLGKIKIDTALFRRLQSGERLPAPDRARLRQSPEILFELLNRDLLPLNVRKAIVHIDCRFDGRGQPPLKGADIPLLARMLQVTNYYDAFIRQRPGKTPLSEEQSRQLLRAQAGKIFDPTIVTTFLGLLH